MRRRCGLLAAAAAVLVGCSAAPPASDPAPATPAPGLGEVVLDTPAVPGGAAAVRARESTATSRPLVLWLHGSGADQDDPVTGSGAAFTAALLDRGYVVASAAAGGNAWGGPVSQEAYRALAAAASARWSTGPVVLLSISMGGVVGLDLLADRAVPGTVGWLGISPVTDLGAARERFSRGIDAALTPEQVLALDPSRVPPERFTGLGMTLYAADDDDRVVPAEQAAPFAARVPQVSLRTCHGGHVAASCFDPAAVDELLGR